MGRVGVTIPVLVMCGLLVSACSQGSSAAAKRTNPVNVTTETARTGWFTQIFDTSLPVDPAQASAVEGFRSGLILWNKSQETMKLVSPVTAYVTGAALRNLKATLVNEKAQDVVIGGTDRLFKTRVTVISGTNATITTCDDGSKFEDVNPSTGVSDPAYNAPANRQYLFETWQMTRLDGRWAISDVSPVTLPDSRAKPCQPLPAPIFIVPQTLRGRHPAVMNIHRHCREPRLGIDIGKVIINGPAHPAGGDTAFFSGDEATMLATPEMDGCVAAIARLTGAFGGRVWLVSKCGPDVQARTLRWLAAHGFYRRTGVPDGHVRFCRTRQDKRVHCEELSLTHFVDDHPEVHAAIRGTVDYQYFFGPQRQPVPSFGIHAHTWGHAEDLIIASLIPPSVPAPSRCPLCEESAN